jgi:predicted amidophosphoribosyltransferase
MDNDSFLKQLLTLSFSSSEPHFALRSFYGKYGNFSLVLKPKRFSQKDILDNSLHIIDLVVHEKEYLTLEVCCDIYKSDQSFFDKLIKLIKVRSIDYRYRIVRAMSSPSFYEQSVVINRYLNDLKVTPQLTSWRKEIERTLESQYEKRRVEEERRRVEEERRRRDEEEQRRIAEERRRLGEERRRVEGEQRRRDEEEQRRIAEERRRVEEERRKAEEERMRRIENEIKKKEYKILGDLIAEVDIFGAYLESYYPKNRFGETYEGNLILAFKNAFKRSYMNELALTAIKKFKPRILEFIKVIQTHSTKHSSEICLVVVPGHNQGCANLETNTFRRMFREDPDLGNKDFSSYLERTREMWDHKERAQQGQYDYLDHLEAFKLLDPKCFENKCVIIFDDVYTSGATMKAAVRKLKEASPKYIFCMTVARTAQSYS